ncbi:MAG: hypothetical protein A2270_10420 [Elusimicrobia bacterium RIFOXYA12_FULL_51_18]|nr:MAG: hypothetical protein A2270_10420 [Elusimicrobia bacterium RIFOXYA12_FULL_51_18]OGS29521.1 MAG: hypothetical protein A2218_00770 [Elusimicrobia bacterium RIFOXYA2_FULL_53_38]
MKMPKDDVLNALLTDLVADQVIRALQLGYGRKEVEAAVARGVSHGVYEFNQCQVDGRETEKIIGAMRPRRQNHESK